MSARIGEAPMGIARRTGDAGVSPSGDIGEAPTEIARRTGDAGVASSVAASPISPEELVRFLNEIFSAFDQLTERHGLEKIKTIGDAYMVVGGLPIPRDDHAESIAEMALEMQTEIAKFNLHHQIEINIRIGINTGPAIAGVIGTKKFIYDLWGDAVNTASRMESHGISGAIQVSQSTYERLRNEYEFEERGIIYVKGKGEMKTYLLRGRLVCELAV